MASADVAKEVDQTTERTGVNRSDNITADAVLDPSVVNTLLEAASTAISRDESMPQDVQYLNYRSSRAKKSKEKKPRASHCRRWTPEQDDILKNAVFKHGPRNWKLIASEIGGLFTPDQCNQHWHRVLNPLILKREWSPEEDDRLFAVVEKYGESSWTKVAADMDGRTDIQCRHRYFQRKKELTLAERKKKYFFSSATPEGGASSVVFVSKSVESNNFLGESEEATKEGTEKISVEAEANSELFDMNADKFLDYFSNRIVKGNSMDIEEIEVELSQYPDGGFPLSISEQHILSHYLWDVPHPCHVDALEKCLQQFPQSFFPSRTPQSLLLHYERLLRIREFRRLHPRGLMSEVVLLPSGSESAISQVGPRRRKRSLKRVAKKRSLEHDIEQQGRLLLEISRGKQRRGTKKSKKKTEKKSKKVPVISSSSEDSSDESRQVTAFLSPQLQEMMALHTSVGRKRPSMDDMESDLTTIRKGIKRMSKRRRREVEMEDIVMEPESQSGIEVLGFCGFLLLLSPEELSGRTVLRELPHSFVRARDSVTVSELKEFVCTRCGVSKEFKIDILYRGRSVAADVAMKRISRRHGSGGLKLYYRTRSTSG